MLKKLSKQKKNDLITYGIVIVAFIAMQILIGSGQISSLFQGLMVPLCTYIILAISLNLVVGILGESPIDGSSIKIIDGFDIKARPMANICCSPPLKVPAA